MKPGDRLVTVGFGAGLTWAAAAIEWGVPIPTRPQPLARRLLARIQHGLARLRSTLLRTERHVYNWAMGPVGKDDWRGKLRQRVDRRAERSSAGSRGPPVAVHGVACCRASWSVQRGPPVAEADRLRR